MKFDFWCHTHTFFVGMDMNSETFNSKTVIIALLAWATFVLMRSQMDKIVKQYSFMEKEYISLDLPSHEVKDRPIANDCVFFFYYSDCLDMFSNRGNCQAKYTY